MATLVLEGGFPVIFLLAFGLLAMAFAVRFATAPTQRVFRTTLALSAATLLTSDQRHFRRVLGGSPSRARVRRTSPRSVAGRGRAARLRRVDEPGILGFTLLSLIALILALGVYRQNPG